MGKLKKTEWSEEKIQHILRWNFLSNNTKKYELFGRFVYDWESDYLAITNSGYVYECEIKISRGDYHNDSKKVKKHIILEDINTDEQRPNYFYYVVPDGLISVDEVTDEYGLIYVKPYGIEIVKKAPLLHKQKINFDKLNLMDKFYYCMTDYMDKYESLNESRLRIHELEKTIKSYEKQMIKYDDMLSMANCEIEQLKSEINKK